MILNGTYHNGAIVLDEEPDLEEGRKVQVIVVSQPNEPKRHTAEELNRIFSGFRINTNGWKFNRDEANERR